MTCETEGTVKLTAAAREKTPAMMTVAVVLKEEVGRRIGMVSDLICLGNSSLELWFGGSYLQKKESIGECVYILEKIVKLNINVVFSQNCKWVLYIRYGD